MLVHRTSESYLGIYGSLSINRKNVLNINWEYYLVCKGFGWAPINDTEQKEHGHIVFFDDQKARILHIDEIGIMFDGAKKGIGGETWYSFLRSWTCSWWSARPKIKWLSYNSCRS